MGRKGVTYEEAEKTFKKIILSGQSLSIAKAREFHGSGSNTTWHEHLSAFKEKMSNISPLNLPETIPKSIIDSFEALWFSACECASREFNLEKAKLIEELNQLKETGQFKESRIAELDISIREAEAKITALTSKYSSSKRKVNHLSNQLENVRAAYKTYKKATSDKESKLREQIEVINKKLDKERERLTKTVSELEKKFTLAQERADASENHWIQLYDNSRVENIKLNKRNDELQSKLKVKRKELETSEALNNRNESMIKEAKEKLDIQLQETLELRDVNETKSKHLLELEFKLTETESRYNELKQIMEQFGIEK